MIKGFFTFIFYTSICQPSFVNVKFVNSICVFICNLGQICNHTNSGLWSNIRDVHAFNCLHLYMFYRGHISECKGRFISVWSYKTPKYADIEEIWIRIYHQMQLDDSGEHYEYSERIMLHYTLKSSFTYVRYTRNEKTSGEIKKKKHRMYVLTDFPLPQSSTLPLIGTCFILHSDIY